MPILDLLASVAFIVSTALLFFGFLMLANNKIRHARWGLTIGIIIMLTVAAILNMGSSQCPDKTYYSPEIILRWLVAISFIISPLLVIWGGVQFLVKQRRGDEAGKRVAKIKIVAGLVFIILMLMSYALSNIVGCIFTSITP